MALSLAPNPVGVADQNIVQKYIEELKAKWATETIDPTIPWWKFWKQAKITHQATLFMLQSLDYLILQLDKVIMDGKDKKATVLAILSELFDTVIAPTLPTWSKPFVNSIKNYVIYTLLSNMIDLVVEKYHNLIWPEPVLTPVKIKAKAKPKSTRKK